MSTIGKIDSGTLGWVKTEIDETLKQARIALEAYAENPADNTRLRFCTTYLHQVLGTLQMVELDGAAMLAQENEALAEAVLNGKLAPEKSTFEVLTRGILSLPDYLSRLQFGQPDLPLRLLPLINELRAARGAEPVKELDLFRPDLSVRPPNRQADRQRLSNEEFNALARTQRRVFQAALLEWLRDPSNKTELNRIAEVLAVLQEEANVGVIEQLFWVSSGLLDALINGDLEASNERKKLLARLDQQIKKLIDGTDKAQLRSSSEQLVKSILYEIGAAGSTSEKVAQLKRAFDLDALLTGVAADTEESEVFDLPTPEALQSVAHALGKEIETAQDMLSAYFDPAHDHEVSLESLVELLRKMSGTLDMLGVGLLKMLIDELIETCRGLIDGGIQANDTISMAMASALLLVETSSRDIHQSRRAWKKQIEDAIAVLRRLRAEGVPGTVSGIEITDAALTEVEFKQLLSVVASEVRINLGKVEEALETFAAAPAQMDLLDPVPAYLNQILGALQILGQDRAADLTAATNRDIQDIRAQRLAVDPSVLDALAVSVGAIGAYLEGLERDRPNLDGLLDIAWNDLDRALAGKRVLADPATLTDSIARNLQQWLQNSTDRVAVRGLTQDLQDIAALAAAQGQDKIRGISDEMNELVRIVTRESQPLTPEIAATLTQSLDALTGLAGQALSAPPRPPSASPMPEPVAPSAPPASHEPTPVRKAPAAAFVPPAETELDEEIIEIFVEDATETIQTITRSLDEWHANPDNREALQEVRRGFHTLKGSGRMVGALEIAELGWAVENMLNRVREGRIPPAPAIFAVVYQARDVLPSMVEHLQGGAPPAADVAALRSAANALAEGAAPPAAEEEPAPITPSVETESIPAPVAAEPEDEDEGRVSDPMLLQIFSNETRGHLETIRQGVSECRDAPGGCLVTEALLRAAHTLRGGARSLKLRSMAAACGEMEKTLQALDAAHLPLTALHLDLLDRVTGNVAQVLEVLNDGALLPAELKHDFNVLAGIFEAESTELTAGIGSEAIEAAPPPIEAPPPRPAAAAPPPARLRPRVEPGESVDERPDPELLDIFLEEAVDILAVLEKALGEWRQQPSDQHAVQDLKRSLHTLKGGARMAGAFTMGNLSHNTESLLRMIEDGELAPDGELFDLLDEVHDALLMMIDQMQSRRALTGFGDLNSKILARLGSEPAAGADQPGREAPAPLAASPAPSAEYLAEAGDEPVEEPERQPAMAYEEAGAELPLAAADDRERPERAGGSDAQIRVRTNLLNNLVNYAGEVSISRSRMQQQIFGFRENLAELKGNVARFRDQIRELEIQSESQILYRTEQEPGRADSDFDPLEFDRFSRLQHLSRGLSESLHDLFTIQSSMDTFVGEAETVLQQQARVNTDLQEGLMRTRMISFATQVPRLRSIVRQTARELGKQVELRITGAEVEVDRNVLERMIGPFEHMIRNAIDHGIEGADERRRLNKPEVGTVTIGTRHEGSEIVIRFSDDGAGLNTAAIRGKALERGLISPGTTLTDEEVIQFILVSGFSTATTVTHLSGRGVGMDVVHNEIKQLGGSITVDTKRDIGTTFIIRLPLTLSITQALMVHVGEQLFAMPIASVGNILEVPVEKLNSISMGKKPLLNHEDQVYPFMHLATRLGVPTQPPDGRKVPVLLTRGGARPLAIQVDGLGGTQEVVVKSVGPQLSEIEAISGATILGDGRVVLILDSAGLWRAEEGMRVMPQTREEPLEEAERRPIVMVVDDSITVRKVTSRHLQKRGMEVIVAKDGIDALEQLREQVPDVMLVDIEMPRMDGYELTTTVRSNPTLKHIPIIMITSRAGAKHRDRALQLGVNLYMTKPYQEDELFRNIDAMLAPGGRH
ncbi:MAG: Hpt domain-containing protein [Gammaproteobacteria bacterium]|nr:Hpt domain-containing protein [Gammaproteobacteria bacterium]